MSIKRSIFESIVIESSDRSRQVDITNGSIMIDYYEDLFSPTITAKIRVVNTGNTVKSPNDRDGQLQSLYNGLPLRGGERVAIKIAGNSARNPGLDFFDPKKYLYVSSISDVISENNRESFTLNLVSREAITNETTRVVKKYTTPINESVSSILTNVLKANKIGKIDNTSNSYQFIGNMRKPFTVLTWLAAKSVPGSSNDGTTTTPSSGGTAGFFFYQTKDGYQFRSIDLLNQQSIKATYTYSEASEFYDVEGDKPSDVNDFKILNYSIERNQNLIEKLKLGTYSNYRMFFNPLDFSFSASYFKLEDYVNKTNTLGRELISLPKLSDNSELTLGDSPTRMITSILDIGTMDRDGDSKVKNADPMEYQSQTLMRYNNMFTQSLNVMIPSNTNLIAGDLIECLFPRISRGSNQTYDEDQSGLYMIKEVCHHFDATNSYTSLKLIRDTFGIKKKKT